jgi:hypothetical protein
MKEYYTYAYLREDGTPYYVGKGTGRRAYVKHRRGKGNFVPVPEENRILILKTFNDEESAYRHEEYMIFHYGKEKDGGILINLCEGGKTKAIFTEEERKQRRKESSAKYYRNNKEKCAAASNKWRNENRDKVNERYKEKYTENPEKYREKRRRNYDPQKRKEYYLRMRTQTRLEGT